MSSVLGSDAEWLEADGLGGFASGTVSAIRTRRYHALLLAAVHPPADRFAFVNGYEAWVETDEGTFFLTSHRYAPDVIYPDGANRVAGFVHEPWPEWRYALPGSATLVHGILVEKGRAATALYWRIENRAARLFVRLLMSSRDYHSLHHENPNFNFACEQGDELLYSDRILTFIIDLSTREGVALIKGKWRYSDTRIIEVAYHAPGTNLKPSGKPTKTYDYTPKAGAPDFDDSRWEIIDPPAIDGRRSTGKLFPEEMDLVRSNPLFLSHRLLGA